MKDKKLHVDRETFPGVALVVCFTSVSNINRTLEQIAAGSDLRAVSLGDGNLIAMKEQDWRRFYDAWYRVREFEKMMDDAAKALEDMTSMVEG